MLGCRYCKCTHTHIVFSQNCAGRYHDWLLTKSNLFEKSTVQALTAQGKLKAQAKINSFIISANLPEKAMRKKGRQRLRAQAKAQSTSKGSEHKQRRQKAQSGSAERRSTRAEGRSTASRCLWSRNWGCFCSSTCQCQCLCSSTWPWRECCMPCSCERVGMRPVIDRLVDWTCAPAWHAAPQLRSIDPTAAYHMPIVRASGSMGAKVALKVLWTTGHGALCRELGIQIFLIAAVNLH